MYVCMIMYILVFLAIKSQLLFLSLRTQFLAFKSVKWVGVKSVSIDLRG